MKRLRITLLFTGPDVKHSRVLAGAQSLPDVTRCFLSEGEILKQYGAQTSGQVLLYNAAGKLVFSGGLTEARGVGGDSAGMGAIRDTVAGRKCISSAPVYGCSLQTPQVNP